MIYLRKFLLLYFDDLTTGITCFAFISALTDVVYNRTTTMSHGYLFSTAILLYVIVKWYKEATYLRSFVIGLYTA
ncbi:MAG: hypothetical protein IPL24_09280 [Bacteroidetes bacterium]|nr:hypothetical protein [Bacteroidota bacterium]